MTKQVTVTMDGRQITVPDGMLVVDAAKMVGIDIPVFCYHPKMEPVGMCRMCLVEIGRPMIDRTTGKPVLDDKGQPKIQFGPKLETACTNPVSDGMVVLTKSEKALTRAEEHRRIPADIPSARLPDLRQGRRVPAAEPDHGLRPGQEPLPAR